MAETKKTATLELNGKVCDPSGALRNASGPM